jgi:hypothetical protein
VLRRSCDTDATAAIPQGQAGIEEKGGVYELKLQLPHAYHSV